MACCNQWSSDTDTERLVAAAFSGQMIPLLPCDYGVNVFIVVKY